MSRRAGQALYARSGQAGQEQVRGDRLLVANNLSDNAVLLDIASGSVERSFDLSRTSYIPSGFPYAVVVNKAGTTAWCSALVRPLGFQTEPNSQVSSESPHTRCRCSE